MLYFNEKQWGRKIVSSRG